jgi:serine O-acetyltransferase
MSLLDLPNVAEPVTRPMDRHELNDRLPGTIAKLLTNIEQIPSMRRLNRGTLPSRENAAESIERLLQLVFPGYFGKQGLTSQNLTFRVGEVAMGLSEQLYDQIRFCMRYREDRPDEADFSDRCMDCDQAAAEITLKFFERLPAIRELIAEDVQTAFDSDPAATSTDETIFCYPGLLTITVQRLAHELYQMKVPLLPRIWTEVAHSRTGIEIHPGASLGRRFFIDHGTGVVIGETCTIGQNVKLYQGVTLGALAPHHGQTLRGKKRHPTIEDDVIIYAGATVLGGDTIVGKGTVIGGSVFLTSSVPPNSIVMMEQPELKIRDRRHRQKIEPEAFDFQI